MENSKHTPGPWEHTQVGVFDSNNNQICSFERDKYAYYKERNESLANAKLIAEAGTVATECGLTPRQLLEQRNELLEGLQDLLDFPYEDLSAWANGNESITVTFQPIHIKKAVESIQKATS